MKKVFSLLVFIAGFFVLAIQVNAVEFWASNSGSNRSSAFTVALYTQDNSFSGVIFEIEYDSNYFQYSNISNTSNAYELSAHSIDNTVTVLYMPNTSINLANNTPMFELKFNAKTIGDSDITIKTREILDINGDNFIDNITPFTLPISIVANNNGTISAKSSGIKISSNSSKNTSPTTDDTQSSDVGDNIIINTLSERKKDLKIATIILPIFLIIYYIVKYIKDKKSNKDKH